MELGLVDCGASCAELELPACPDVGPPLCEPLLAGLDEESVVPAPVPPPEEPLVEPPLVPGPVCVLVTGLRALTTSMPVIAVWPSVLAALGPLLGGASLLLYIGEGAIGLPFFAGGQSGSHGLFVPTAAFASAGYLWGFVVAAFVVGWLARRGWDRTLRSSIGAMLIGEVILYLVGLVWLAAALNIPVVGGAFGCRFPTSLTGCDGGSGRLQ